MLTRNIPSTITVEGTHPGGKDVVIIEGVAPPKIGIPDAH